MSARRAHGALLAAALLILLAPPALAPRARAQDSTTSDGAIEGGAVPKYDSTRANPAPVVVQHWRPTDARGIDVFEPPKEDAVPYEGFRLQWGAAFTQQFQALEHRNNALPRRDTTGVNMNQLIHIGPGFNNAGANLYLNAQLARGVRVALTSYLSSRHHNETWVKDGYLLVDGSPWENPLLDRIMRVLTLRLGHFEVNYGDMHFRRSDNGQAMFNPLVGNLLMDAFTTEIGGEAYLRAHGLMAMAGVTGGELRGQVTQPERRAPTYLAKLGFDRQVNPRARLRLTGSLYTTQKSVNNTLYTGDRAGSRYYFVLENTLATESANAWSGNVRPGFTNKVTAWVVNPFVKLDGLELFGNVEQAKGNAFGEAGERTFRQNAAEAVYRFAGNRLYVAGRYNTARGRLAGIANDVTVQRTEAGGGWFLSPNLEAKAEWVRQDYRDFPMTDIRSGGRFDGEMVEAVVSF